MRPNTVFLIGSLLALVFGLGFLLAPSAVLPAYGVMPDAATALMARFFGVALVQLGIAYYLVREARDPATVRGLALGGVVGSVCGVLVALMGVRSGVTNALGWSTVVIYALLLVGYAGCLRARAVVA